MSGLRFILWFWGMTLAAMIIMAVLKRTGWA